MPRPLRIIYPNACYHVMNRGARRQQIFKNDHHRTIFIDLLQECCKIFNIKIYAYCLMDNHYHLLLSTPEANLPRAMRHLNGVYTQTYNRLMKKDGSLFRGRYHAKLVDEDCYRLLLTRYIHLNPVDAGIVKNPEEYRWSSYRAYLGFTKKYHWLSINTIIEQLRESISLSNIKSYQDYVEKYSFDEMNNFTSTKFITPIIGSAAFKEKVLKKIDSADIKSFSSDINQIKTIPSIDFIMKHVSSFYQIDYTTLINGKSGTKNLPKLIFIYICNKEFGHNLNAIAKFVGFSRYESVSAAARKCHLQVKQSSYLAEQINCIVKKIRDAVLQIK